MKGSGNTNWQLATLIFLVALLVRIFFALTHPHFNNIFSVRGVPYSDGLSWTRAAFNLAEGNGLGGVYRPLYSVFLALFYTWQIPPYALITIANIFFGAFTALLIYLVAEHAFKSGIALAASAFFAFDPSQLVQIPQAVTEPIGLLFSVASIYCLLLTSRSQNLRPAFFGGVLLALSNLARPLTLVCAFFYVVYLFIQELIERRGIRRAIVVVVIFCTGTAGCLTPWLVRQRLVNNIWGISTNLGEAFYAATSPKHRVWTPKVRLDADRAGVPNDQGHRYQFFMEHGKAQLLEHPAFYLAQTTRAFQTYMNSFHENFRRTNRFFNYRQWTGQVETMQLFFCVTAAFLIGSGIYFWRRYSAMHGALFLLISVVLLTLWHVAPPWIGLYLFIIGVIGGCWLGQLRQTILLGGSVVFSSLSSAMFNNTILYRGVLMTDWLLALFYLVAFYFLAVEMSSLLCKTIRRSSLSTLEFLHLPDGEMKGWHRALARSGLIAGGIFATFLILSTCRLLYLNFVPGAAKETPLVTLNANQVSGILQRVKGMETGEKDPLLELVRLTREIYYFPAGAEFAQRDPLFKKRPFDCSILRTARYTVVFPGLIPSRLQGHQVALIGRLEGLHPSGPRPAEVMQCTTIVPLSKNNDLDYGNALTVTAKNGDVL